MKRILPLLYSLIFFSFFSSGNLFGQNVNCPQCSSGICEGESLADYFLFSGYTFPIEINSVSGAATGSGTNIFNYTFIGGAGVVNITFEEGNGTIHTENVPVNVNAINAAFNYTGGGTCGLINFNANASSATGTIVNYDWSIFQINGAINTLVTTLTGQTPSYTFSTGGTYDVCLTITDNNNCTSEVCELVNVGNVNPALTFEGSGSNLSTNESQLVVPYCNSSSQSFNLLAADNSELNGLGISNYTILVDGVVQYNAASAPGSTSIYTAVSGTVEYIQVDIILTDVSGCSYTTSYQVYIGNFSTPSFSSQLATTDLGCPEEELVIQNNNNPGNPNGSDYTLEILCGGDSIVVDEWVWEQTIPENNLLWTPPFSSCLCDDGNFYFSTSAVHPCMTTPQLATSNFQVALPPEAEFTRSPEGNICFGDEVTFEWLFGSNLDYPSAWNWCDPNPEWSITDPNGVTTVVGFDPILNYIFPTSGVYEVCLNVFSDCGVPQVCESICVNPPLSDVTLTPVWNIPPLLCPDDEFTSELTYTNLDFCDTPEVDWELFFEGTLVETYTGLTADIVDLQKGEYVLVVTFTLADCGEIEESTTFEVVAPPIISPQITGPVSDACEGDVICFDEWFCIDDCGDELIDFELILYQGFLSDCDDTPSGTLVETITNTLPNPPYANCDPTPTCSYEWTAIPGQYTLWIKAENNCGPDFECITIDVPFPNIPVITGDDEVCVNTEVELNASLVGGTFTFDSCPAGCPTQGNSPGQYTISGSNLTWDTQEGITEPGDYIISYGGDCIGTGTFTVTVYALPDFSIESTIPQTVCEGDQVDLSIDYSGPNTLDGCTWINQNTGQSISPPDCDVTIDPAPGVTDYVVSVTDINGCQASETIAIEELTQPFTQDCSVLQNSYCNNTGDIIDLTTLLSPYPSAGTINWTFDGNQVLGTSIPLDGLADGTYTIEWEWLHQTPPNCSFQGECSFDITPPVVPVLSGSDEYCQGQTVSVSASSSGITGNWSFASCPGICPTDAVFAPSAFSWITDENDPPGVYTLEYGGDCLETSTFSFTLNALPEFNITTSPGDVICEDETVTLNIQYQGSNSVSECFWINENTGTSISPPDCQIQIQPTADLTTYSVIVEDGNGCESAEQIDISIQTQPFSFDCASIEPAYCDNEVATIDLADLVDISPTSTNFEWFLNGNPVTGNTIDVEALSPADSPFLLEYVYTSPTAPNCIFEGACSFNVTDLTTPLISNTGPICLGDEILANIAGNNGLPGNWDFTSCPNNDCPTDFSTTTTTFTWQTDGDTEPGEYTLTYSGECLETVETILVINAIPGFALDVLPGNVICDGEDVDISLNATGGSILTCEWVNITTGLPLTDNDCSVLLSGLTEDTSVSVQVEDENGCTTLETIDIAIQTQPFSFDCASIEPAYCDNEVATIDLADLVDISPTSTGFEWFLNGNPVAGNTIDVEALSPADSPFLLEYVYTSPTAPNCIFEGACSFNVTDLTTPLISNTGPICLGDEILANIAGNNGLPGNWDFTSCPNNDCPTDFSTTTTTFTWQTDGDTEPGEYTLTYSGECLETVETILVINAIPGFALDVLPGNVICDGEDVDISLNATGGSILTCEWVNITTGLPLTDNDCSVLLSGLTEDTSVSVQVEDENGCTTSETIDIAIQQQPFTFECPDITSYCDNEAVVIDFNDLVTTDAGSTDFEWTLDGSPISGNTLDLEPLDPAGSPYVLDYTYTHPDTPNCTFTGSCIFIISALTTPLLQSNGPLCPGETIEIELSQNSGFTGEWTFTDCPSNDCPDDTIATDVLLTWVTDVTDLPGDYTVEYSGNCLETVTLTFTVNPLPEFTILSQPDATICNGDSIYLEVENTGLVPIDFCQWFLEENPVGNQECAIGIEPLNPSETYVVEVTDINGCFRADSLELNIQQQPFTFDCSALNEAYCDNEQVVLEFSDLTSISPDANFEWFLNDSLLLGSELNIEELDSSTEPYVLSFNYNHPTPPNCLFIDSCSFFINELTLPEILGSDSLCIGEELILTSQNTDVFEGDFVFTACPSGDCPANFSSNSDTLTWLTDESLNLPGTYLVQYTGTCLDTAIFALEVLPSPQFTILTDPGETVCAEDTISVSIDYTGTALLADCFMLDANGSLVPEDPFCSYTLLPSGLAAPYEITATDIYGCLNTNTVDIDVQIQPFEFDCVLESTYCDNSTDVIELDEQISPFPVNGSLNWFINGAPLPSSSLNIFNLVPGSYSLAYVYEHGDSPFCTFSDTCNFQVTELVRPDLSGQFGYCQGETVELFADSLEGFTGEWINVSCPQPPCIPTGTNPNSFTWSSADAPLGEYVFSYEGLCLLTETYTIEILGNPTVDWTPEDATPCLNECLPFFPDIIEDEDLFGWEYHTFSDTAQLFGNEVCFEAIGNPEELDICLWAEAYHPVRDTVFTCYVSDCETITPVFSPDNPPVAPTEACPGVVLEIGVDYSFYDDCAFTLNNTVYDDCEEILIPDGPYGTFPYMIELGYSGCSDSLFGNIFIPQPPSAELEIEYDPCNPDVFAELINLEGMALNFDWSVSDNAGVNYDLLMSDDSQENPVPNPIPLSQLDLPTDTTFYIEVEVFNFCESLTLQDTVNYIASPSIEIDIANTSGDLFCLPQEFDFEIGEFATAYIDSVNWTFESIYDYGNVSDTTYTNLQFPPSLTFENNGQTDTVNVYVTAYNQCGLDQDTINFVLIPPNVYLEMPDFFEGVCPGDGIDIPTLIVEGDPFNGCEVTSSPLIPGLSFDCSESFESVSVFIPESTPPGIYSIETTISGCGSSNDFTEIEIFAVPDVDFEFDDQACTDTEVAFTNLTEGAVSFEWDFGEFGAPDNTSILSFPIYAYDWPGIYDVTLTAFSDSNCAASVTKPIEIFGPNPSFEIDSAQICSGGTAVVEFESQDDIISLLWEFVLPGEDTLLYTAEESVANTFFNDSNNVDVWNVSLTLEDIYGCVAKADTQVMVLPQPTAFFRHSSLDGCAQGVPINFYNLSTANTSSTWTFDNPLSNALAIKYETNPTYEFPLPGIYTVTLLAQNQFGCEAQFARILGCNKVDVYVPNAFTPDGNSLNEVFKPVVPGIESIVFTEPNFYTFQVFDRWGLMVFETHDYEEGWAGTSPNAEFYAPSDVYIWRLEINFPEGLEKYMGHVTLVR